MPDVIGIRFKSCGRIYDFEVNGSGDDFRRGDLVVVESDLGLSIGSVVIERHIIEKPAKELKKVLRKATDDDLKQKQDNEDFEKQAREYCLERIMARGLPMKLICTEATLDKKRIVFYFTADGRIDFRELVKDLAAKFKTRIEMRQIGVRDEAKIVGGFGMCGRELCCKTFLTSFEPISIRMAKQQDLVLNMAKLSGICGRLMCCLSYEILDETKDVSADEKVGEEQTSDFEEEADVVHDVIEDALQTEEQNTAIEQPESSVQSPGTQCLASDSHQAEPQKGEDTEQKNKRHWHRKRKRWRWKKFHKQSTPEEKQE